MKHTLLSVMMAPLFIACAHVSKKDCLEKDWQAVGFQDGSTGLNRADMTKVAESCSRFEMANPPANQYMLGYELGLKTHCTEDRGFTHGERGVLYPSVCSNADANFPQMVEGWKKGIASYCSYEQGKSSAEAGSQQNKYCDTSLHAVYFKGFESGARSYCSDHRTGFYRGKSGASPFPYCPGTLAGPFERAFDEGARLYREITTAKNQLDGVNNRLAALRDTDISAERQIRYNQSRIQDLEGYIEQKEGETRSLEAELRKCTRQAQLCDDSYVDSLERRLKDASEARSNYRRERSDLSLAQPGLFAERTRLAIEIAKLESQSRSLQKDVRTLEDSEFKGESDTLHVRPKTQRN